MTHLASKSSPRIPRDLDGAKQQSNAQDMQRRIVARHQGWLAGQRDAGRQAGQQVAALAADEQPAQVETIFLLTGLFK